MKTKLLGYYNYTVVLTYIGMMVGFLGIICTVERNARIGLICLMIAGVCDMFDGAIASTKKRNADEKCFGIQIDSLSDLVCFGILPAIITCSQGVNNSIAYAVSALYVLAALIRLAYFNVDEQNRQREAGGRRMYYYGLPVTTVAAILPLFLALGDRAGLKTGFVGTLTLAVTGVLFLTPFKIKKPEMIGKIALGLVGALEFAFLIIGLGDV